MSISAIKEGNKYIHKIQSQWTTFIFPADNPTKHFTIQYTIMTIVETPIINNLVLTMLFSVESHLLKQSYMQLNALIIIVKKQYSLFAILSALRVHKLIAVNNIGANMYKKK